MKDLSVIIAAIIAFAVTLFSGYFVIPYLRKLKFGQTILEEGPNWHKSKQGTPTMGGIMMILGFIAAIIITFIISLFANNSLQNDLRLPIRSTHFIAGIGLALCMAAIGFVDDFIKVVKKRNLGLTARQTICRQSMLALEVLHRSHGAGAAVDIEADGAGGVIHVAGDKVQFLSRHGELDGLGGFADDFVGFWRECSQYIAIVVLNASYIQWLYTNTFIRESGIGIHHLFYTHLAWTKT